MLRTSSLHLMASMLAMETLAANPILYDLRDQATLDSLQGHLLNVHCGETIELLLTENPSTGYGW